MFARAHAIFLLILEGLFSGGIKYDADLTNRIQDILHFYSNEKYVVVADYDKNLRYLGYTEYQNGVFYITLKEYNEDIIFHEAAHVITWNEKEPHGERWQTVLSLMGYSNEVERTKKVELYKKNRGY